jgi:hypothetical protein
MFPSELRCNGQTTVRDSSTSVGMTEQLLPRQAPEQKCAEDDEENVRDPDEKFWMHSWISAERVGDDDEKKITKGDDQSHGETD